MSALSSWGSQIMTLWFNVLNHLPHPTVEHGNACKASDVKLECSPNLFFWLMNRFQWIGKLVGEDTHGHHHNHGSLAHRPGLDLPFHIFVRPLRACGLVWNIKINGRETPYVPHGLKSSRPPPPAGTDAIGTANNAADFAAMDLSTESDSESSAASL